ncbi:MAG: MFS transporter [Deltaproteobacteria bacterium]|nr:MFS transporter [Deltaproteobacteria bacterium]MDZ4347856.1 MFS transporter [Candidatus Binatia bacterium]
MTLPTSARAALLSPLRHRDFRLFWTGLLLSSVGSQFTTVAMAWQIYELTDSPLQIGLIGLARAVPQIAILLFGGLLADAVNRRRLMMLTQASLFGVSGALALLTLAGGATPLRLYVATMFLALFSSLEAPSRQAIVSNLVPREDLSRALAMHSSQRQIAVIAGPSVAGLVLAFAGPALCYAVDAFSWLIMFAALALIRTRLPERGGWRTVSLNALGVGLRFVWRHPVIFPLLIMDFGANIFGTVRALLPVFARDILLVGPEGLGVLYAASAVGSLLGAVGFSLLGRTSRAGRWILGGVTVYGVCVILFAQSQSFWLSVACLIGYGIGDTISAILRATINQLSTPDELRGRMASIHSLFTNSGPQLGQFQAGGLASLFSAEIAATSGGLIILLIVAVLALGFPKVREYRIAEYR